MQTVKFAYNMPMFGDIEIEEDDMPSTKWPDEDIIKLIEKQFPEAIDIEILEVIND